MITVFLHTFPSVETSLISVLTEEVGFPQIALMKLMSVYSSLTYKFPNQTIYYFSEIFEEFIIANLVCSYELN